MHGVSSRWPDFVAAKLPALAKTPVPSDHVGHDMVSSWMLRIVHVKIFMRRMFLRRCHWRSAVDRLLSVRLSLTDAGGTRQGQPHRGAPNGYNAERAQRPCLGGGEQQAQRAQFLAGLHVPRAAAQ